MNNGTKFLGTFKLNYPEFMTYTKLSINTKLKIVPDQPTFQFYLTSGKHVKHKLNSFDLGSKLCTLDDEEVFILFNDKFVDIFHFYSEIWLFLISMNYIHLDIEIIGFQDNRYIIQFKAYLTSQSIDSTLNDSKFFFVSTEEEFREQRDLYSQKIMQMYSKECLVILFDMLKIHTPIKAILSPEHQTTNIDDLIYKKYKQKSYIYLTNLEEYLPIPILITDQYREYYKEQSTFITQDNVSNLKQKLIQSIDYQHELQLLQSQHPHHQTLQQYYQNIKQNDYVVPNLLSISEQQSKEFTLAKQPPQLQTNLHSYQLQALQWMLFKEGNISAEELNFKNAETHKLNKMWSQLKLPEGDVIYFNEFSGQISETFIEQTDTKGGILADEMGLGKSIVSLALILSSNTASLDGIQKKVKGNKIEAGTLIIGQLSVIDHWIREIQTHTYPNTLQHFEYVSSAENVRLEVYDIVITSYGVLKMDFKKKQKLFQYKWKRVILDEAHYIKAKGTLGAKAAFNLNTDLRWCLTGTPIHNSLDDLYSLLYFLQVDTFSDYHYFNYYINKQKDPKIRYHILHRMLENILLRRTKLSRDIKGDLILNLPQKNIEIIWVEFDQEEKLIYNAYHTSSMNQINQYFNLKCSKTQKQDLSFTHIFQLIMKLRQLCGNPRHFAAKLINFVQSKDRIKKNNKIHQLLNNEIDENEEEQDSEEDQQQQQQQQQQEVSQEMINNSQESASQFKQAIIKTLLQDGFNQECQICNVNSSVIGLLKCGHYFCESCITRDQQINNRKICLFCREPYKNTQLQYFSTYKERKFNFSLISSKVKAIMKELDQIINKNEKVVIYTQWKFMLNELSSHLRQLNIEYQYFDGSTKKKDRSQAIEQFSKSTCQVILISLKSGSVGINLSAANNIFIIDPWWNPAVEDQAIDRIYRLGQKKDIFVKRFICKESIEERVIELHKIKRQLFMDALHLYQPSINMEAIDQMKFVFQQ